MIYCSQTYFTLSRDLFRTRLKQYGFRIIALFFYAIIIYQYRKRRTPLLHVAVGPAERTRWNLSNAKPLFFVVRRSKNEYRHVFFSRVTAAAAAVGSNSHQSKSRVRPNDATIIDVYRVMVCNCSRRLGALPLTARFGVVTNILLLLSFTVRFSNS